MLVEALTGRLCDSLAVLLWVRSQAQAADEFGRRSGHPYLTYSDANIARLKERIRNEPAIADAWSKMLGDANRMSHCLQAGVVAAVARNCSVSLTE